MKLIKDIYLKRAICIFPIESEKRRQAIDEIPYLMKSETNSKCGMNLKSRGPYLDRCQAYAVERTDSGMAQERLG